LHSELISRNHKIKSQLQGLIEKEKNLENLLLFALKNFAPNLFFKNNELKYWESIIPELEADNSNSNLIVEKSTFQKNDVLNKIFKELKNLINCYRIIDNTDQSKENPEIVSYVKINPLNSDKKEESSITGLNNESTSNKNTPSSKANLNINNDLNDSCYYNQFNDWQKRIYDNFEDSIKNLSEKEDMNIIKSLPRVINNVANVKRNLDDEEYNQDKLQGSNSLNPGVFGVLTKKETNEDSEIYHSGFQKDNNMSNSLVLMNVKF